jgi:hypothetical protein
LEKSSSFIPQARSIARAPARLAPASNVWLRNFLESSVTPALLNLRLQTQKTCPTKKLATDPLWMVARISRNFTFRRHHPLFTFVEIIRQMRTTRAIFALRRIVMALRIIASPYQRSAAGATVFAM